MLNNKHVVVIGGTSGIGREVAAIAKSTGARVTVVARDPAKLEATSRELDVTGLVGDITANDVRSWAAQIEGTIDHVYFSAGTFIGGPFLDADLDGYRSAIEARMWGPAKVIQAIYSHLAEDASITFTGGVSTRSPNPGAWVTNIGTAVADQMAKSLAVELAPRRFNTLAPGFILTPMWDMLSKDDRDGYTAFFTEKTPTKRLATVQDAANAVIALFNNPGINGQAIYVDGGYTFA
jgi:NAD(P)-dependent dehydrogenase (short-subunit alcohol dehydrogenase family)